jgi:hypothetical protein
MSDARAKRAPRESVQRETAPVVTPQIVSATNAAAEPVAAAAAATAEAARETSGAVRDTSAAATDDLLAYSRQAWAAMSEAQAAAARGFEAMLGELSAFAKTEIAAATDGATALLGAKTLSEAVEVNLGYARRSFDALVGSSAKLSEIGAKTASDASRPILSRLGESWKTLHFG